MKIFLITLIVLYSLSTMRFLMVLGAEMKTKNTAWNAIAVATSLSLLAWTIYMYAQGTC